MEPYNVPTYSVEVRLEIQPHSMLRKLEIQIVFALSLGKCALPWH